MTFVCALLRGLCMCTFVCALLYAPRLRAAVLRRSTPSFRPRSRNSTLPVMRKHDNCVPLPMIMYMCMNMRAHTSTISAEVLSLHYFFPRRFPGFGRYDRLIGEYNTLSRDVPGHSQTASAAASHVIARPQTAPLESRSALPPGWEAHVDDATGVTYYHHAATQQSRWDRPVC